MPSEPRKNRILFCIGAQKAGTTWLYKHLDKYPQVHFHRMKELQFFTNIRATRNEPGQDVSHEGQVMRMRTRIAQAEARFRANPGRKWLPRRIAVDKEILDFLLKGQSYHDIVSSTASEKTEIIADMSPEYCLFEADTYRELLDAADDVRFVFLMRDPIERAWSQVRFSARIGKSQAEKADLGSPEIQAVVQKILKAPNSVFARGFWTRSRYDQTIEALEQAVPREKIYYGFYESFFKAETIHDLTEFIGLPQIEAAVNERVFSSKPQAIDPEFREVAAERLAPVYPFVAEKFGSAMPYSWQT